MKRIYRYVVLCLSLVACLGSAAQAQDEPREQHVGRVQDWTYSHVTMSGGLRSETWGELEQNRACCFDWWSAISQPPGKVDALAVVAVTLGARFDLSVPG